jgi:hypothetical protein
VRGPVKLGPWAVIRASSAYHSSSSSTACRSGSSPTPGHMLSTWQGYFENSSTSTSQSVKTTRVQPQYSLQVHGKHQSLPMHIDPSQYVDRPPSGRYVDTSQVNNHTGCLDFAVGGVDSGCRPSLWLSPRESKVCAPRGAHHNFLFDTKSLTCSNLPSLSTLAPIQIDFKMATPTANIKPETTTAPTPAAADGE